MLSDRKISALKTGLLFLAGALVGISLTKVATKKEHSLMLCQTRLAMIGDKFGGIRQVIPLQEIKEGVILGLVTLEGPVVVKLSLTNGNFLLEEQCVRQDGKKVLIEAEKVQQ